MPRAESAAPSPSSSRRAGASVVVGYRSGREEAEALAQEIGGRAVQADVSEPADAARLVEEAGDLDILVNNAGLTRDGVLARMSDDDWRVVLETNLSSVFYTCRAVTRGMMKRRAGSIVNMSSIVGVHGNWGQANYAASKAGIIGFTKSLAQELGSRGVRANVVAPGYVKTQLTDVIPEEARAKMLDLTPLGAPRRSGGRRRGGTLPLLRRGFFHHRGGAPRRRRARDVSVSINGRRRVVITGLGCVSPLGNSVEDSWRHLLAGESGATEITQFDHSSPAYNVHFACELKDFDPTIWIDRKAARRMDRFAQMILASARQAESDSGIDIAKEPERVGASVATGIGGLRSYQDCYDILLAAGTRPCEPVLDPEHHPEHGRRLGVDRARHERPADVGVHGVRRVEHGDRRRRGLDPDGPCRHHARGRNGGADHRGWHRRLRRDARALAAER